jgi:hypothetical protein
MKRTIERDLKAEFTLNEICDNLSHMANIQNI